MAPGKPGESNFEAVNPLAVAVDVEGNVYAIDDPPGDLSGDVARVLEWNAAGESVGADKSRRRAGGTSGALFPYVPFHGPVLTGLATNICADGTVPTAKRQATSTSAFSATRRVGHVNAYGSPPIGCEPPPLNPPEILAQFATSVGREEATLKAQINPRFFADTTYYLEYGTEPCKDGGCDQKAPLSPALLTGKSINKALTTAGVVLGGLEPGTTYHYRFVAQSGGGGPVFGIDPDGREGPEEADPESGLEASFTTFAAAGSPQECPNDALRGGAGAKLPDCRGYEMVSPLDKGTPTRRCGWARTRYRRCTSKSTRAIPPESASPSPHTPPSGRWGSGLRLAVPGAAGRQAVGRPRASRRRGRRRRWRASPCSMANSRASRRTSVRRGLGTSRWRRWPRGRSRSTATSTGAATAQIHPNTKR